MKRELDYEYDIEIPSYFAISKYCNIRCTYCYLDESFKDRKSDIDDIAISAVREFVKKAREERFALSKCYLHGAEPTTLSPTALAIVIDELLSITTDQKIGIQTNGIALNKSYLAKLGDYKDKLAIGYSVDLPAFVHDTNRQKTYEKIIDNICTARDRGYSHRLLGCVTKDTVHHLNDVVDQIQFLHNNFPGMAISFKHITGEHAMSEGHKIIWADFLCQHGLYDYDHSVRSRICHTKGNDCWWFEFSIDGEVTACNKSFNNHGSFANWRTEHLKQIVLKRRTLYQNVDVPSKCFGCEHWSYCHGGCPVDRFRTSVTFSDNKNQITKVDTISMDCAIKMRVFDNMKAAGLSPRVESNKAPQFIRQKEYKKWVQTKQEFNF
jgi:uncharacterized protein